MKHAIIAQIEISLPAKADELVSAILLHIVNKPLWTGQENRVAKAPTIEGNPAVNVEMRFDKLTDRDDLTKYLKSLDDRPNVKVTGTIHDCFHDEGNRQCNNWMEI